MKYSVAAIALLTLAPLSLLAADEKPARKRASDTPPGKVYVYKHSAGQARKMEIYFPPGHDPATAKAPGLILFHGGGWKGGNLSQFRRACAYFASRGLVAATVDYHMLTKKEEAASPDGESLKRVCISDAKRAIRWFKQHAKELGLDPSRVITGGGSAGGHVSVLATTNPGLNDPEDAKDIDTSFVAYLLFNPAFSGGDAQDAEVNALAHVTPGLPPAIAFFGTADGWKKGWDALHTKLKLGGNTSTLLLLAPDQPHGFFNRDPWQSVTLIAADRFLVQHGLLRGEPTLPPPATGEKLEPTTASAK